MCSNTSDSSGEHLNDEGAFPVRCKTASLEKLRDPGASRTSKTPDSNDDSWDSMFDENGDCVNNNLTAKLKTLRLAASDTGNSLASNRPKSSLGHSSTTSSGATSNCASKSSLSASRLNGLISDAASDAALDHVLELVSVGMARLSTGDIRLLLANSHNHDYDVIWVDDVKALLVFSSKSKADEAFRLTYPNIKLKRLNQASQESRSKAFVLAPQPFKKRPETSAVLARRLVSGALGLRVSISPEQRAAESKKLQDARGKFSNKAIDSNSLLLNCTHFNVFYFECVRSKKKYESAKQRCLGRKCVLNVSI